MNFKTLSKKLLAAAMVVVCGCGFYACSDNPEGGDDGKKVTTKLEVMFGADEYEMLPGQTLSLPFTINGIANQEIAIEAKCNNADCSVEVVRDEFLGDKVVFTAPKITQEELSVIVLLNVTDAKNDRDASARATIKIAKSDELTVAFQSVTKSIAIKAGESISLPVVVGGIGAATIGEPTLTITDGWTAAWAWTNKDKGFGNVTLTAPGSLGATVALKVVISDDFNRNATLDAQMSIVAITTAKDAANCHIVAPGETLTINAVKGNSAEKLTFNNATLLWQEVKGLVKSVSANANEGVIVVELNEGVTYGNAVVAAKQDDEIVWSWHVWVTDYDINAEENIMTWVYNTKNEAGEVVATENFYWMDRNLGAYNANMWDDGAMGLLYQWGRKDPFTGSDGESSSRVRSKYDINDNILYDSIQVRPVYTDHVSTNLELAIQNPTVFYTSPSSSWPVVDWLTDDTQLQNHDLWGGVSGHKSIYDPCPYGWKVPVAGKPWAFRKLYNKPSGKLNDDGPYDETYPWYIYYDMEKATGFRYKAAGTEKEWWFPFCGERGPNDGKFTGSDGSGMFWAANANATTAFAEVFAWGNPASESGLNRTYGASIRCIKDADVE